MTGPVQRAGESSPERSMSQITCASCGSTAGAGLPFCPSCGKKLTIPTEGPSCPRCGTAAPEDRKYCPACGQGLDGAMRPSQAGAQTASQYVVTLIDEILPRGGGAPGLEITGKSAVDCAIGLARSQEIVGSAWPREIGPPFGAIQRMMSTGR